MQPRLVVVCGVVSSSLHLEVVEQIELLRAGQSDAILNQF